MFTFPIHSIVVGQTGRHVWDSFFQAGLFAQSVCLVLLAISTFCLAVILRKSWELFRLRQENEAFFDIFNRMGGDFETIFDRSERFQYGPMARVFRDVYHELSVVAKFTGRELMMNRETLNLAEKRAERSISEEVMGMEKNLVYLATATTICPFIGLIGTVWGLLGAFRSMGIAGSANVATVGTGVAEALITTLAGLAVAVLTSFFYNLFQSSVGSSTQRLENFASELISRLARNMVFHRAGPAKRETETRRPRPLATIGSGQE